MATVVSGTEYTATSSDTRLAFTAEQVQRVTLPMSPAAGQVITAFDQANRADWYPKIFYDPIGGLVFVLRTAYGTGEAFWDGANWNPDPDAFWVIPWTPPPAVSGTTYYVSPSGSDSNNGTSPSTPWQTVAKARAATPSPGDAVLFQGGHTYSDDPLNPGRGASAWNGTSSQPILLGAYGVGRPTFSQGVYFEGSQATWLILDRLIVPDSFQLGTTGDGVENIVVQRCEMYQTAPSTDGSPMIETFGTAITFQSNYIHDIGSHGIQPQSGAADTHTIADNLIYAIGLNSSLGFNQHQMYLNGPSHTVTGNQCIGTVAQRNYGNASSAISARGHNTIVQDNYIACCNSAIDFEDNDTTAGTTQIVNNTGRGIGTASGGFGIFITEGTDPLIESPVITGNDIQMVGTGNQLNIHPTTGTVIDSPNTFRIGGTWEDHSPTVLVLPPGPPTHFDAPFRLDGNGQVVVVEQDSPEEIGAAILNAISFQQGDKLEDPNFGIPHLLFKDQIDPTALTQAIQRLEPRPTAYDATVTVNPADASHQTVQITATIAGAPATFSLPRVAAQPSTYTPVTVTGALLIGYLAPIMTEPLAWYLDAVGAILDPLYNLVMDQGLDDGNTPTVGTYDQNGDLVAPGDGYQPGWGALLNPQVATGQNLAYLGQFVGVPVPAGVDDATARSLVLAEDGRNRGTDAAVIAAAQRTLTGTQTVYYFPRTYSDGTGHPGWAGMVMLTSECPSLAVTEAAVNAVRLGGIRMWFSLISGWTIGALEGAYTDVSDVEAAFVTVNGIEGDITGA